MSFKNLTFILLFANISISLFGYSQFPIQYLPYLQAEKNTVSNYLSDKTLQNGDVHYLNALRYAESIYAQIPNKSPEDLLNEIVKLHNLILGLSEGTGYRTEPITVVHSSGIAKVNNIYNSLGQLTRWKSYNTCIDYSKGWIDLSELSEKVGSEFAEACAEAYSPMPSPEKLQALLLEYSASLLHEFSKPNPSELDTYKLAAFAHQEFVRIHPFEDGNGRTARLLMNIVLMRGDLEPCVFVSNEDYGDAVNDSFMPGNRDDLFLEYLMDRKHCNPIKDLAAPQLGFYEFLSRSF